MSELEHLADPLSVFPPEVVLRILEFTPASALASLTAVSRAWHQFIDVTHQQAIYAAALKNNQPSGRSSQLTNTTFSKLFEGALPCKELCKRHAQLTRNWAESRPSARESVLQVGNEFIWRFRPDFKRRIFISTSHAGGLYVTDMDTGLNLWNLPSTLDSDEDAVRPFAHLEYQDGMAVFDREGDALEVWQADLEGAKRGEFRRIAILDHDCQTRGFQLSYGTLCVVSTEGQGFVYDMTQRPPQLTTHLDIEYDAVGHLDQSQDVVIYSMGPRGYHVYDKKSGEFLGELQPSLCTEVYHIRPPTVPHPSPRAAFAGFADAVRQGTSRSSYREGVSRKDHLVPIKVERGPFPTPNDPEHIRNRDDEWGAGMLDGDLFTGFSRAGRVFVCSNWRKALKSSVSMAAHSDLIECDSNGRGFDLGGWLSVRNHRVMFEIQDRVYVVGLDDKDRVQVGDRPARGSFSLVTSSVVHLNVPVSFMALYDDAIMTTYTTIAWRQSLPHLPGATPPAPEQGPARIFPIKAVRVLNLAPKIDGDTPDSNPDANESDDSTVTGRGLWGSDQAALPLDGVAVSPALVELITMLDEDLEDEEEDEGIVAFTDPFEGEREVDSEWEDVEDEEEGEEDLQGGQNHGDAPV
ncbi:hypothetical protein BO86DRAFT_310872 [Aspergillus japonicus CBS 114.51]|uniref:F-box domain-containing protein n=1 Tax=Aspergillus japonicus CBS 114.51 TaxID=1448312 RepID=A0A8T8X3J9_ASPJA|nr:hypothetical protein BO86DRAFT_310872 [Aspergillus japonicus CBS 114.51]RAH82693.1 hypothetical protein BO86DRAFT_310872 [Aspergillus japonicus CBS 114.51]